MTSTTLVIKIDEAILVTEEKSTDNKTSLTIKDTESSMQTISLNLRQLKTLINFINDQFDGDIY